MELTFNQVEAVFTERFAIPDEKAIAFRGRIQHLQRLGFPNGVRTGSGKKAGYGWLQVVQLTVALDLIDLGFTPSVAAKSVRQSTDRLIDGIYMVASGFKDLQALAKALQKARCPFGITRIAVASAFALTFPRADDDPPLITIQTAKEFTEQLNEDPGIQPAAAFINLGSRMMVVGQLIGKNAQMTPMEVAGDLLAWSTKSALEDTLS